MLDRRGHAQLGERLCHSRLEALAILMSPGGEPGGLHAAERAVVIGDQAHPVAFRPLSRKWSQHEIGPAIHGREEGAVLGQAAHTPQAIEVRLPRVPDVQR